MLAVTHHYIVQASAIHCGKSKPGVWFDGYEVLGDDINIFDTDVAKTYLSIMGGLGVGITLSKSVCDPTGKVTEFAKRTAYKGIDVSGLS